MVKTFPLLAVAIALLGPVAPSLADDLAADGDAASLEKAAALRAEAREQRIQADARHAERLAACAKKFLVNSCRRDAEIEHLAAKRTAQALDNEGLAIEREVKRARLAERDRRQAEEATQRPDQLAEREARLIERRQQHEARAAAIREDKVGKAEAGAKRRAADEERLQRRQADHAARIEEKRRAAEQRQAEQEARKKIAP